jgi:hypothetical protein
MGRDGIRESGRERKRHADGEDGEHGEYARRDRARFHLRYLLFDADHGFDFLVIIRTQ